LLKFQCTWLQPLNPTTIMDLVSSADMSSRSPDVTTVRGVYKNKILITSEKNNKIENCALSNVVYKFLIQNVNTVFGSICTAAGVVTHWDRLPSTVVPHKLGFEVLTAVVMKITMFLDVIPRSLKEICWHFEGTCCLHLQGQWDRDAGSMFLSNISKYLPDYIASNPRRQSFWTWILSSNLSGLLWHYTKAQYWYNDATQRSPMDQSPSHLPQAATLRPSTYFPTFPSSLWHTNVGSC
jgi:hypothetical protein